MDDGEALVANRENVAPLEDDQDDEINALTDSVEIDELVLSEAVETIGVFVVEGNTKLEYFSQCRLAS